MTIHFGRWSDQIAYISCEDMSCFSPLITPILVDVSLAFRIKGNLHVWELFLKDEKVQLREFYIWLFSKSVWKNEHVKNKNDVKSA